MATINWHDNRTLEQHMLAEYSDFNVFQLMRLLLCKAATNLPMEQRLRFKADLSSAFPANEFSHLNVRTLAQEDSDKGDAEKVIEITSANFCIASVLGPLPEPFTEWVRDLAIEREPAMADFLDIFNQRINLLRFELKQAQTLALNSIAPAETDVAQHLAALMGLGTPNLAKQVPITARGWLGLAGLLANHRKNSATAVHILKLVLKANVTLTPFVGGWKHIETQDITRLGVRNQQLGQSSLLGRRVWDQHARVRLEIDTLSYERACQLVPPNQLEKIMLAEKEKVSDFKQTNSYFAHFSSLLTLLFNHLVDCEIVIRVAEETIPFARLMSANSGSLSAMYFFLPWAMINYKEPIPMRLGQTAWLKSRTSAQQTPAYIRYLLCADDMMEAA